MKRTTFYLQAVLLLIIAGLITGCAIKYVEPSSGPTASIRFVASRVSSSESVFIDHCAEQLPRIGLLHNPLVHGKKMGMPLADGLNGKDYMELKIPAGIFSFHMQGIATTSTYTRQAGTSINSYSCSATMEFEAVAGRLYEAEFIRNSDNRGIKLVRHNDNICVVRVNELVESDGKYVRLPEKTTRERPDKCQ